MDVISPLAHAVPKLKDWPARNQSPWGACIHTTGSGIVEKARKAGADPLDYAVAYYLKPESYGPNYVIGYSGQIVCVSDDTEKAQHIGLTSTDRERYLDGSWKKKFPTAALCWAQQWKPCGFKNPMQLFVGKSPNEAYIGIEVIPVLADDPDCYAGAFSLGFATTFTAMQHESARALLFEIGTRWGWGPKEEPKSNGAALTHWRNQGRIVGHEDVTPLSRSDKGGGWDPGALRLRPRWDWKYVLR